MLITDNERDKALWNQFKNGDEEAFVVLFRSYYSGLYNYGCKICRNQDLVEDCIQELFLELWKGGNTADILSPKAYIFRAFKFKLVRHIQRNHKIKPLAESNTEEGFELSHDNFLIAKEMDERKKAQLLQALQELSPRQQEIIYLKFYLDLDYEAVSAIMQINYQAARNLIYQSIKVLKKNISFYYLILLLT